MIHTQKQEAVNTNNWELSKEFYFEAGHRLVDGYKGKCNHPHGHSWRLEVFVRGNKLNDHAMLMDFKKLKAIVQPIVDEYDHSFLVNISDKVTREFLKANKFRTVTFKSNPTSEHLAEVIAFQIMLKLPKGVMLSKVVIDETCTSKCIYNLI